jgi:hydrogenase 3 maturation protease
MINPPSRQVPLLKALRQWLDPAEKVALLGIGSDLRGDDAAGVLVAQSLSKQHRGKKLKKPFKVFIGGTAPENLTGEIRKYGPTHLIIVDAADLGLKKGTVRFIDPKETGGFSSSTHKMPMKIFVDYLTHSLGCEVVIIGIQPGGLDFNTPPSQEVKKSVKYVSSEIVKAIFGGP